MPPKPAAKPAKPLSDKELKELEKEKERHEQEVQLRMMIASTLANDELELKKHTLMQYQELSRRLKDENVKLREEMEERDRDSLQVVEFLRREVEKKQEQIEALKNQLEDQKEKAAERLRERELELQEVIKARDGEISAKADEIQSLEAALESVALFKKEKHEMEHEILELKRELSETKERYERDLSKLRFHSLEEKVRLKAEEKALNEKFTQQVNQRAMDLLDPHVRQIHTENIELRNNHRKLEQEYTTLSMQSKALEEERRRKQREIELSQQSVEEYSKQGYRAHKEIRELSTRNRQLETNIARIVTQYEGDRQQLAKQGTEDCIALEQNLRDARQALEVRSLELHRIRRLARVIISQRSDLETFFNEALEFVRQQVGRERLGKLPADPRGAPSASAPHARRPSGGSSAAARQRALQQSGGAAAPAPPHSGRGSQQGQGELAAFAAGDFRPLLSIENRADGQLGTPPDSAAGQLPPIAGTPGGSGAGQGLPRGSQPRPDKGPAPGSAEEARVDIGDLSWADKERVLRILFAKINSQGAKGKKMAPTPPQSIDEPHEADGTTFLTQQQPLPG
eukprot:TRINITY_DN4695_c3_g1_i1.p1 TRINITY_DN4695_c3_g1~~TRINITY_DN4695_c3_g1_i1.p1  ORF type:complete len:604 (+),score=272.48 TRINITY_DN4695_c3_g1_i1:96-1814(+)